MPSTKAADKMKKQKDQNQPTTNQQFKLKTDHTTGAQM